jgi:hypothetical protein
MVSLFLPSTSSVIPPALTLETQTLIGSIIEIDRPGTAKEAPWFECWPFLYDPVSFYDSSEQVNGDVRGA